MKRKPKAETPKPWQVNFKSYRVIAWRQAAVERGSSDQGVKQDLVARLELDEEVRFSRQPMEEYERAVQELEQASLWERRLRETPADGMCAKKLDKRVY